MVDILCEVNSCLIKLMNDPQWQDQVHLLNIHLELNNQLMAHTKS